MNMPQFPLPVAAVPQAPRRLPTHIAIVMDGNGRWAEQRNRPRSHGHRAGVLAVRRTVEACLREGVPALTLFAFSSENWRRPASEVNALMSLFLRVLHREVDRLHDSGVRLRFVGDLSAFPLESQVLMTRAMARTIDNRALALNVAINYGGRWDITEACREIAAAVAAGRIDPDAIDDRTVRAHLALADMPEPDLFIRTGGEKRISNFLLWQLAYAELWFTDVLWPDFDEVCLARALADFAARERRFGQTSAQVRAQP